MREARSGVFCHYLADKASASGPPDVGVEAWNEQVDGFNIPTLVEQLCGVGARYFGLTIGQNSGFYCAPNAAYDAIVGRTPSRCSRRDLIGELAAALRAAGIRFMAYLPSGAPDHDALAVSKLKWCKVTMDRLDRPVLSRERLPEFQLMWESVIREWSQRWGELISAWWIDGCYYSRAMYDHPCAPNFASLLAALRSGNPAAAVALNPGVRIPIIALPQSGEDFTAGEVDSSLPVDFGRPHAHSTWPAGRLQGEQLHVLLPMGHWWGQGQPRFSTELATGYTKHINAAGGAVTWDVPIGVDGLIPLPFVDPLAAIGRS